MIDRAPARRRIKKFAGLAENRIGLAPQYLFTLPCRGESFLRRLNIDAKMFRQHSDVAFGDLHSIIYRAAICRTLRTIVVASFRFDSCHPWFGRYRLLDFRYSLSSS